MLINIKQILFESIQEALEVNPNAIGFFDKDFKLIYCNDVMASLFGKTKEEAIGTAQKALLKEAYELSKGVKIDTDNFEAWFEELNCTQQCILDSQFETDTNEGHFFKVTRITLSNGITLVTGTDITELKQTQRSLESAIADIETIANTDQLTGIFNRRYFADLSEKELARSKRYKEVFSLLVLDLDNFKSVNDNYGHHVGDEVLINVAKTCNAQLRTSDALCRIGGEEFAILLPHTKANSALEIAERVRSSVKASRISYGQNNQTLTVSVSIGVTEFSEKDSAISDLLLRADKALYQAKRSGRDKCILHSYPD